MEEIDYKTRAILKVCSENFRYFLKFVKIIEPPSLENSGGVIDFIRWPHLDKAIDALLTKRLIVWLKSRQIGASWLIAAFCVWFSLFRRGAVVLLLSKGEDEAMELLGKCRSIITHLPNWGIKLDPDSRTEIGFPFMDSKIRALSSTEAAGASFTASVIVSDEWDLHPYAIENYTHIKPCIDSSGGQFIGIFTRNPMGGESLAVRTFSDAIEGRNGYTWLFDPYDVRPGRDVEWYESRKSELSPEDLSGLTPELYMFKCYPRSVEEALRPPSTISVFDSDVLLSMLEDTKNPITLPDTDIDYDIIKIYKPFQIGQYYIASCDVAHGVGGDFSVSGIMNVKTGGIVSDIMRNDISVDEFAEHFYKQLCLYRKPKCYPEDNEWGHIVTLRLQELGYRNFGYQDEKKTRIGWKTDKKTRQELFNLLIPAVNNCQITIYNRKGIEQLFDLVRNPDKEGRIEAKRGGHDDYAIMLGICWARRDTVSIGEWRPHTVKTLTFRR